MAVVKPAMSLEDRKLVKSIATTQRALAYERKNGGTSDELHIQRLQGRLKARVNEVTKRTGIRLSLRSKADAAKWSRARSGSVSRTANTIPTWITNGMGVSVRGRAGRLNNNAGAGALYRRATAQQGNFLTGGTDKTSGRLQPAGYRKVKRYSKPY